MKSKYITVKEVILMSLIVKQTLKNKEIKFWKIIAMILGIVVVVNLSTAFFSRYGTIFGSIAAIIILLTSIGLCFFIIYKKLSYYNYRIIDHEAMFERVIGRANHVFFHIDLRKMEYIKPYRDIDSDNKRVRTYKFVIGKNKEAWYVVQFRKDGKVNRLIIEPDTDFLNAMEEYNKKDRVISS